MELRNCSNRDAVRELALAGHETGLSIAVIGGALVDLVAGGRKGCDGVGPEHAAAVDRWMYLIDARAKLNSAAQDNPTILAGDVTIRCGGVDDYTRC